MAAAPASPIFISAEATCSLISHKNLITHFQNTLPTASLSLTTPHRHTHPTSPSSSLLLMPSWSTSPSLPYIGIKLVAYHPENSAINLPGVHASYVLFSAFTGQTLALIDATELTLLRTSCVSALGSKFLSREDARVLVMIGAGNLAPHLIKAHLSVRPNLKRVIIWNRTAEKAEKLAARLREEEKEKGFEDVVFEYSGFMDDVIGLGDIVSCATNSEKELVMGEKLKEGAHLDLVGSFKKTMKECDDEAIRRGRVFIDNDGALVESGELIGAFERGVIGKEHICGNLVELINGEKEGRKSETEITVFKNVGSGVVDVLTAQMLYETCIKNNNQVQN